MQVLHIQKISHALARDERLEIKTKRTEAYVGFIFNPLERVQRKQLPILIVPFRTSQIMRSYDGMWKLLTTNGKTRKERNA